MAMEFKRRLPIPMEIREEMPLSAELTAKKQAFDAEVAKVFTGEDARKVLIIGPCSADREDSVLEYMNRLAKTAEEVKDKLIIIPRVYTNKPRTKGPGYKGLLHNPDPEAPDDLLEGVKAIRHMHLRVIEETGFFTADEMLYPSNYQYLVDLLSYVAVGARSVENQEHRLVSSGISVPVGMKNPTAGSTTVMLNSIYAAQAHQSFIFRNWEVECDGNPLAHAVIWKRTDNRCNFNPRSYKRSDNLSILARSLSRISIHAPTRGATFCNAQVFCAMLFQSTLLQEERLIQCAIIRDFYKFQSTLLQEERQQKCTIFLMHLCNNYCIVSI